MTLFINFKIENITRNKNYEVCNKRDCNGKPIDFSNNYNGKNLLKDNKTLVMISAVKSLKANFKFDIVEKKLELYPVNGKFDFIISSIAKNCGHYEFKEHYKCSFYKPLISSTLIN